jgi:hypothetical protein
MLRRRYIPFAGTRPPSLPRRKRSAATATNQRARDPEPRPITRPNGPSDTARPDKMRPGTARTRCIFFSKVSCRGGGGTGGATGGGGELSCCGGGNVELGWGMLGGGLAVGGRR